MRDVFPGELADASWRAVATRPLSAGADPSQLRSVAEEVPVGLVYNGVAHAVMMATPADLEDFAFGFSLSEGIVGRPDDIRAIVQRSADDGTELLITLAPEGLRRFLRQRRVRALRAHSSCGICGLEELEQVHQRPMSVRVGARITGDGVERALALLRDFQPLSRSTRAAHAAAWATPRGELVVVREDVGRHNALDKLIGACLRQAFDPQTGFCLITSRCSFEMAQKTIAAGISTLVAISAPTALAVRTAEAAGLTLIGLDRDAAPMIYGGPPSAAATSSASHVSKGRATAGVATRSR